MEPCQPGAIRAKEGRSGTTCGFLNDAISIYFADATIASAFVARWCAVSKVETAGGLFHRATNEPSP